VVLPSQLNGEVVVSFDKMNRIKDFDPMDQTMTVEARRDY